LSRCLGPLSIAAVLLAAGCASTGPSAGRQERAQAPPPPTAITDASYDWHVLVLEPFGVLLKESPLPLHEVLLFHDETSRTDNDNKDCYSIEGTPPRFLGARPDHYLLCFDHDRLTRIDAAVAEGYGSQHGQPHRLRGPRWHGCLQRASGTVAGGRDRNGVDDAQRRVIHRARA
jgi:hypothetical protein